MRTFIYEVEFGFDGDACYNLIEADRGTEHGNAALDKDILNTVRCVDRFQSYLGR